MKSDMDVRRDVEAELRWEPRVIDATGIGVAVKKGVTTISGHVQSYAEKWAAERAVERVSGVTAVANELDVHLPGDWERTDEDIAQAAVNALTWNLSVPRGRIQVEITKGWVTLKGDVDWQYQRDSRRGLNLQFGLADLLRQSVYSRLAGYEDLNDAECLAADPAFRLIGSRPRRSLD